MTSLMVTAKELFTTLQSGTVADVESLCERLSTAGAEELIALGQDKYVVCNAMQIAALFNNVRILRLLVEKAGADPDTSFKSSPLLWAVAPIRLGTESLQYLVEEVGVNVNAASDDGFTALHQCSDLPSTRILLENGAEPNIKTHSGMTALMNAV